MIKPTNELRKNSEQRSLIFEEIDINYLHNKYGPEGLYELAQEMLKISREDVNNALEYEINKFLNYEFKTLKKQND